MKNPIRAVAVISFMLCSTSFASRVAIEKATGPGVGDTDLFTMTEIMRSGVSSSGHEVLGAGADDADFTLRPKLLKLGGAYLLVLEKIRKNKVVYSNRMKAASIEEIDEVAQSLIRATIDEIPAETNAHVSDLTSEEREEGMNRRPVRKGYFMGFGPAMFTTYELEGMSYWFTGGYAFDAGPAVVRLQGNLTTQANAKLFDLGIGGSYFLSNRDTTPFLMGDFGYGGADSRFSTMDWGFVLGVGGGVQFLRTTTLNLELGLRYSVVLSGTNPGALGTRLAIYF